MPERAPLRPHRVPHRRSLRARLTLLMVLSTTLTVLVFACAVYLLVRAEGSEREGPAGEDASEQVLLAMFIAGPICLLLSVAAARWSSRRSLAPLDAVIRDASIMTARDLHLRLDVPHQDDELRDLVVALNALLGRLDEGFAALGSYAASASHELRTPLAVIINDLEIGLRRPRAPDEWERIARTSLEELRRLGRLVEALLELARATAAPSARCAPFDLRDRLDQTLAALDASTREAGVHLVLPDDGDAVWLGCDPDLLMNAVRELVRNAARYASRGATVRVRVDRLDDQRAAIQVDDDGPGVDAREREAIFAPFTRGLRGRAADADGDGGRGLGLAVAKRSVEPGGGTISAGDSPEGGARFTIVMPTCEAPS